MSVWLEGNAGSVRVDPTGAQRRSRSGGLERSPQLVVASEQCSGSGMLAHVASRASLTPTEHTITAPPSISSPHAAPPCPAFHPHSSPPREERYNEIRDEMRHMLARVGWKPDFIEKSVPILPISGWMGDNLIKKSEKMGWWKGMDVKTVDDRTVHVNTLLDVSSGRCCGLFRYLGAV